MLVSHTMDRDADRLDDLARHAVEDDVYAALSHRDRRIVLYYVRWRREADVEELADVVTGWRTADVRGMATRVERDRVGIELRARHLPILDDAGLVDYDREVGTVGRRSLPETVDSLIDMAYDWDGGGRESS